MGKTNADDKELSTTECGETTFRRKRLAEAAGGEDLGCSLHELPAGCRSWPYHYHAGNEEALFVLSGSGSLRLDGEILPLEAGDYVALPAAENGAHRVVNDSTGTRRYLMVSTMNDPDVTVYSDSEKVGVFVGSPPGRRAWRIFDGYYRCEDAVDYWLDEA